MAAPMVHPTSREHRPSWAIGVAGTVVLALPFLVVGILANHDLFMSNHHAHLIEKALMVQDRGRVELIGFVYPPLPFMMLLPWPHSIAAVGLAALAGGLTLWVVWQRISVLPMPRFVKFFLLAVPMCTPAILYLGTQSLGEMLALLLLLLAWIQYITFTRDGQTGAGFKAGLALGCAFFVNHYTAFYAVPFAMVAPVFVKDRRPDAVASAALVLFFPVLMAVLIWAYVNWVFTGDALRFLLDPGSSLFAFARPDDDGLAATWSKAIPQTGRELLATPLYLITWILVAFLSPARALAFLVPVALITGARSFGMIYPDHFALGTYTLMALVGLPRSTPGHLWPVLLIAGCLQLSVIHSAPVSGEMLAWSHTLFKGEAAPADVLEESTSKYLAQLPPRSVLLDDRFSYRLVSRAGTAEPFLLPADTHFHLAESQPADFVNYILTPVEPSAVRGGRIASVFPTQPPAGFRLKAKWSEWQLYEREDRPGNPVTGGRSEIKLGTFNGSMRMLSHGRQENALAR